MKSSELKRAGEPKLSELVVAFFRENPFERLQAIDIAVKFDAEISQVPAGLKWHVSHDYIRVQGNTYTAGPALLAEVTKAAPPAPEAAAAQAAAAAPAVAAPPVAAPAVPAAPARQAATKPAEQSKAARRLLPRLDLSKVVIRDDVPLPAHQVGVASLYQQLLDTLKPGQMAEVDEIYRSSITKTYKQLQKQPSHAARRYEFRALQGGKVGIWRMPDRPAQPQQ